MAHTRLLCLGNELLADDAFGIVVAGRIRQLGLPDLEVVEASVSGFNLVDYLLDASRLVVVDTMQTAKAPPGTVRVFREQDVRSTPGGSPHYVGLFEALAVGRALKLKVPEEVVIIAVEAADCETLGGAMHPAVAAALAPVLEQVQKLLAV